MRILYIMNNTNSKLVIDISEQLLRKPTIEIFILTLMGSKIEESKPFMDIKRINLTNFEKSPRIIRALILPILIPFLIYRAQKIIKKIAPDVVHTNLWLSDIVGITAASREKISLIVSTQHDCLPLNPLIAFIKKQVLKKANIIIAVSETVLQFTKNYFEIPIDKLTLIYNGTDINHFIKAKNPFPEQSNKITFGIVARLEKIKGHIYYLEAMEILKNNRIEPPTTYFIGNGSRESHLKMYCAKHKLKNIRYVGKQHDIVPNLKNIDVVILPSLSEGFGVVLIEALAAGKLVIASDTPSIRELIKNNKTGLLVKPGDSKNIAEVIMWIFTNPKIAIDIAANGNKWILLNQDLFDIKATANKYFSIYQQLK